MSGAGVTPTDLALTRPTPFPPPLVGSLRLQRWPAVRTFGFRLATTPTMLTLERELELVQVARGEGFRSSRLTGPLTVRTIAALRIDSQEPDEY